MTQMQNGEAKPTILELTARVGQALQSSRGIETILEDIIDLVIEIINADACSIFLYEGGKLKLKATRGIDAEDVGSEELRMGEGITGRAAQEQRALSVKDFQDRTNADLKPAVNVEEFRAMQSLPMLDGDKLLGVLNVYQRAPRNFSNTETDFLTFVATQLVGAIRNAQLYEEVIRGFREMATIHQVGQIVTSLLDLDELLPTIARTCAEHLSARGCVVRLLNRKTSKLEIKGAFGVSDDLVLKKELDMSEGVAGMVATTGAPILRRDDDVNTRIAADAPEDVLSSVICVPLTIKNSVIGTLGVFDVVSPFSDEPVYFQEEDVGLVSMIGTQVAMAIENARLYEEAKKLTGDKDKTIKELSILLEITNIMRSSLDLEELLYIILTSVTMGHGLGFNRAALFMLESEGNVLAGRMAVGPLRPEDAGRHWHAIDPEGKTMTELVKEWGQFNMTAGFKIDRRVKTARIPVKPDKGVLARTILERCTFNVRNYIPERNSEEQILADVGFSSFATVPLVEKDNVAGLIVVDNLVTRDPITEDDVQFLKLFANQAALAIEMSRVYKNLELTNRRLIDARDLLVRTKTLATLGEFSAGVAHELRNPLVSIGGFAKRLTRMLEEDTREAHYATIIAREVEGLEKILNQILDFVGGARPEFKKVDVAHLFERVFMLFNDSLLEHNIELETHYDNRVQTLLVDEVQLRQLFINLVKNAIEAMKKEGGILNVTTTLVEEGSGGVGFEVADTGVGISSEDLSHIFDPFFSKKSTGTGLGLPMCSRIVETNHGGRIFVDSKVGKGTNVLVWLPSSVLNPDGEMEPGS